MRALRSQDLEADARTTQNKGVAEAGRAGRQPWLLSARSLAKTLDGEGTQRVPCYFVARRKVPARGDCSGLVVKSLGR